MKQKEKKSTQPHPPGQARRFLLWFLRDELAEEVLGDLEEQFYATLEKKSPAAARWNYWRQVFNYLRPFAIKNIRLPLSIHPAMYRHHFKIAFRTMARQKGFSFINILGLTISLTVVLLLFMWIQDEVGTDRFHSKGNRIYDLKKVIPQEDGSLAFFLADMLLPTVRTLTDKPLAVDFFSPLFLGALLAIFVLTSIFAGSYPAFVLTSFKPVLALKGRISDSFRHLNLRKGLVITQFILAALLIIGAVIIREQINFIHTTNIGLNRNNLIKIEADDFALEKYELLKAELLTAPGIATVSASSHSPVQVGASTTGVSWTGKREGQKNQEFYMMWVDSDFAKTMEIPLSAGRFYRPEMKLDTSNIVLNEKAAEVMGLDNPVGQKIQWWGMPVTIIGVVRDFNFSSLYNPVEPFAFILDQSNVAYIFVRPESGKTEQALTSIQKVFEKVTPASYLAYEFVDEQYGQMYKAEALMGKLADYFAFLSIFISCIGIIGLSTFFAEQKVKEIGIRKILGAGVGDLVVFLSRNFLWPVLFGMLIGLPLSWYLLNKWLSRFAYAVDISWWMLAVPELLIVGIVGLIVGFQGVKAARVNPVESLRLE